MVWEPTGKLPMAKVAVPDESSRFPGVRSVFVVESKKSTLPVGVPEPGALAVALAVKVNVCPKFDELAEELTAVVVLSLLTVWLKTAEVLVAKLASPL